MTRPETKRAPQPTSSATIAVAAIGGGIVAAIVGAWLLVAGLGLIGQDFDGEGDGIALVATILAGLLAVGPLSIVAIMIYFQRRNGQRIGAGVAVLLGLTLLPLTALAAIGTTAFANTRGFVLIGIVSAVLVFAAATSLILATLDRQVGWPVALGLCGVAAIAVIATLGFSHDRAEDRDRELERRELDRRNAPLALFDDSGDRTERDGWRIRSIRGPAYSVGTLRDTFPTIHLTDQANAPVRISFHPDGAPTWCQRERCESHFRLSDSTDVVGGPGGVRNPFVELEPLGRPGRWVISAPDQVSDRELRELLELLAPASTSDWLEAQDSFR